MAGELIDVESNIVMTGGATTAALPNLLRKSRRSASTVLRVSSSSIVNLAGVSTRISFCGYYDF
jgi:hypothetical protein